jgi:homoserine/homoserine lactone efflux protein
MDLVSFTIACIIFSLSPGAGAIASMGSSLSSGYKIAFSGIIGLQSALIFHILIVYLGLGALLANSPEAFDKLKIVGVIYLAYLGINKIVVSLKSDNNFYFNQKKESIQTSIYRGFLINLTNPKSIIFLAAFLPQFVKPTGNISSQYLILGTMVVFVDALIMSGYVLASSSLKQLIGKSIVLKFVNVCFGFCFFGIASALYFYKI